MWLYIVSIQASHLMEGHIACRAGKHFHGLNSFQFSRTFFYEVNVVDAVHIFHPDTFL